MGEATRRNPQQRLRVPGPSLRHPAQRPQRSRACSRWRRAGACTCGVRERVRPPWSWREATATPRRRMGSPSKPSRPRHERASTTVPTSGRGAFRHPGRVDSTISSATSRACSNGPRSSLRTCWSGLRVADTSRPATRTDMPTTSPAWSSSIPVLRSVNRRLRSSRKRHGTIRRTSSSGTTSRSRRTGGRRQEIGDIPVSVVTVKYSPSDIAAAMFASERAGMRSDVEDQQGWFVLDPQAEQLVVHTGHAVEEEDPTARDRHHPRCSGGGTSARIVASKPDSQPLTWCAAQAGCSCPISALASMSTDATLVADIQISQPTLWLVP